MIVLLVVFAFTAGWFCSRIHIAFQRHRMFQRIALETNHPRIGGQKSAADDTYPVRKR